MLLFFSFFFFRKYLGVLFGKTVFEWIAEQNSVYEGVWDIWYMEGEILLE